LLPPYKALCQIKNGIEQLVICVSGIAFHIVRDASQRGTEIFAGVDILILDCSEKLWIRISGL